jgi:hypothetical protein
VTRSGSDGKRQKSREYAEQIGDSERVVQVLNEAALLTLDPPDEYTFAGETEPLSPEDAAAMAEVLSRAAIVALARWWRDLEHHHQVEDAVNALDVNVLRFALSAAIAELADSSYDLEHEA